MTQYIAASLSLPITSQRPTYRNLPIYQNSRLSCESKSFSNVSSVRRFLLKMMAEIELYWTCWLWPTTTI